MSNPKANDLLDLARQSVAAAKKKGAGEAAVMVARTREVEVQWRDGKLEKITEATTRGLSAQLYVDGRYSTATTSDLRPEALGKFLAEAVALTRVLEVDEHRKLPDPELYEGGTTEDLEIEDARQAALTADERRAWVRDAEQAARATDASGAILSVTSAFADSGTEIHRAASNGFEGSYRQTSFWADVQVSVKDADGRRPSEYDYAGVRFLADLPTAEDVGRRAGERALARLGAAKGKSAVLPLLVENRVAGRLTNMLLGPLSASAVQQKRSFLDGKVGQKVTSDVLHLTDDPLVKRGLGSRPFDSEGIAARVLSIFEGGVLKTYFVDSYYGRKLGIRATTGGSSNLSWRTGKKDQAALIAGLKDAILVTAFLGGNSNSATGDYSLGVNGRRIRKGAIAEPLSEMNIAGNQLDLWKRLVAVGSDPFPYSTTRTPSLLFDKVQFAGV